MATSYSTFVREPAATLPADFHDRFRQCLGGIQSDGLLARNDVTQPMGTGTRLAKTRVTRCLIGKPGITYRYLGTRMFAHPWSGQSCSAACASMRTLSEELEARAAAHGGDKNGFNLVLLNRMTPEARHSAKQERDYGMGPVSVAWHADCSLQDATTISVYVAHHARSAGNFALPPPPPRPPQPRPWRVALRIVHDAEGPTMRAAGGALGERDRTTPAVLLPLHDGDCYHMVLDFNHHHQHAVIQPEPASSSVEEAEEEEEEEEEVVRYSSTHRVAVEEGETFGSVRRRALKALAGSDAATAAQWREEQSSLDDLEFEWLRQFYAQGAMHRDTHEWWVPKMGALHELWLGLERLTCRRVRDALAAVAGGGGGGGGATDELLELLRGALARRQRLRSAWAERARDPLYAALDDGYAPLPCLHDADALALAPGRQRAAGTLPAELSGTVESLDAAVAARRRAVEGDGDGVARKKKNKKRKLEAPLEEPLPPSEEPSSPRPPPAAPPAVSSAPAPSPAVPLAAAANVARGGDEVGGEEEEEEEEERLCVEAELLRRDSLRALRLAFAAACRARRPAKGGVLSCFSKWHFALMRRSAAANPQADPLLPIDVLSAAQLAEVAAVLVAELVDDGFGKADAEALATWLHAERQKVATKLAKRLAYLRRAPPAAPAEVQLRPSAAKPGLVDVVHGEATLQLSERRLATLRELHAHKGGGDDDERRFGRALLAMMLRYQALDGGGFQCAVPPPVFECLRRQWGVACEGFASPLNCTPFAQTHEHAAFSYCSAFPDVDARFGSSGSFFGAGGDDVRAAPPSGSFQLNPPFSAELYAALVERCERLLARAEAARLPLSFALVIGATAPALRLPCVVALQESAHFRGRLLVGVADHVYVCGRQHMKPDAAIFRACDTGVFFLQTSAAAAAWPVTDAKLARLREAFKETNSR